MKISRGREVLVIVIEYTGMDFQVCLYPNEFVLHTDGII